MKRREKELLYDDKDNPYGVGHEKRATDKK